MREGANGRWERREGGGWAVGKTGERNMAVGKAEEMRVCGGKRPEREGKGAILLFFPFHHNVINTTYHQESARPCILHLT